MKLTVFCALALVGCGGRGSTGSASASPDAGQPADSGVADAPVYCLAHNPCDGGVVYVPIGGGVGDCTGGPSKGGCTCFRGMDGGASLSCGYN